MSATTLSGPALARARVYKALATLFSRPDPSTLAEVAGSWPLVESALEGLGAGEGLLRAAAAVREAMADLDPVDLQDAHTALFEPSGGLACPPTETTHTTYTPAHGLTRGAEVADVAGFYKAFGMEVEPGTERPDHLVVELSFVQFLAVKEAVALADDEAEGAEVCGEAARSFLRDHLAAWIPSFAESLEEADPPPLYRAAGALLAGFVAWDAESIDAVPPAPTPLG